MVLNQSSLGQSADSKAWAEAWEGRPGAGSRSFESWLLKDSTTRCQRVTPDSEVQMNDSEKRLSEVLSSSDVL